jgi:hypothetical protein
LRETGDREHILVEEAERAVVFKVEVMVRGIRVGE